jgi:hypothetical protein
VCTVILGFDVVEPGSIVLGANRDEDPERPSSGPVRLLDTPPVAGGRDLRSGGTWLAIRERRAAVALLNRRDRRDPGPAARAAFRSRGLLTLEVAAAGPADLADPPPGAALQGTPALARAGLARAARITTSAPHAACAVLWVSPEACWVWRWDPPDPPAAIRLATGWHVITHADLDDRSEPRTARLLDGLGGWTPRSPGEAADGLFARLRLHGDGSAQPPVCIHEGRMPTVSSSVVWLSRRGARYLHIQGRPCLGAPEDHTQLLAGDSPAPEAP